MDPIFTRNQSWTTLTESAKKYEESKGAGHTSSTQWADSIRRSPEEADLVVKSLHGAVLDYHDEIVKQKKNAAHYKSNMKFGYAVAGFMGLLLMIKTISPYWINAWRSNQTQS